MIKPHPKDITLVYKHVIDNETGYESNKVELGSEIDSVIDSVEEWYGENLKDCGRAENRLERQVLRISFQVLFRNNNNNNQINYYFNSYNYFNLVGTISHRFRKIQRYAKS